VVVTDPAHPLFGRRFDVVSMTRRPGTPALLLVAYRHGILLRIPLASTNASLWDRSLPRAKLSAEAVGALLTLVKEYEPWPRQHGTSGPDSNQEFNRTSSTNSTAS